VYTTNSIAKLPEFGDELGKGGNGQVLKCYVVTPNGKELFACKVEEKVILFVTRPGKINHVGTLICLGKY